MEGHCLDEHTCGLRAGWEGSLSRPTLFIPEPSFWRPWEKPNVCNFFDLDHQPIDDKSLLDSKWRTDVITKEDFCAALGLRGVTSNQWNPSNKDMTHVKFLPKSEDVHGKRLSRRSKTIACSWLKKMTRTGLV